MEERLWYKFTEHNDNEGETWRFFIKLTQQEHKHIKSLLELDGEYCLSDYYKLSDKTFNEETIDVLVENGDDGGYMPSHMKRYPPYQSDILALDEETASDEWYKGQFWN